MLSTNGVVYSAGWENDWLFVMYETNNGSVRVGYVPCNQITGGTSETRKLDFAYTTAVTTAWVSLTDDPARGTTSLKMLAPGTEVIYLASYVNNQAWDYIDIYEDGDYIRGFIPVGNLNITTSYGDGSVMAD